MKATILAVTVASLMALTGCSGMTRQQNATVGGAAVGGLVGNAVFGGVGGALGGAAVGGLIGNEASKR